MLLTKECDYGIRIMRALGDGQKRTVKTICDVEHVPHKYAYKILKKLQNAGLVKNKLGPNGGYFLQKSLDSFSIYDIICAVDDRVFLFDCLKTDAHCPRNTNDEPCGVHKEFEKIQESLIHALKAKTVEEVLT